MSQKITITAVLAESLRRRAYAAQTLDSKYAQFLVGGFTYPFAEALVSTMAQLDIDCEPLAPEEWTTLLGGLFSTPEKSFDEWDILTAVSSGEFRIDETKSGHSSLLRLVLYCWAKRGNG